MGGGPTPTIDYSEDLEKRFKELKLEHSKVVRMLCKICKEHIEGSLRDLDLDEETETWYNTHSKFDKQRLNAASQKLIEEAKKLGYELSGEQVKKLLK